LPNPGTECSAQSRAGDTSEPSDAAVKAITHQVGSPNRRERAATTYIPLWDVALIEPDRDKPRVVWPSKPHLLNGQCKFLVLVTLASSTACIRVPIERSRLDHEAAVNAVAFGPDGTRVATASDDRGARVWVANCEQLIRQAEDRLTRNLTQREWQRYFRDEPYRRARANLP
jgi:WD40 repeat protein